MSRKMRKRQPATSSAENVRVSRHRGLTRPTWKQWLAQHRAALGAAWTQLAAHRLGSMVNVLVIGLALALPLLLDHAIRNLALVSGAIDQQRDLAVFLDPDLAESEVEATMQALAATTDVAIVRRRSPEEGLAELRQWPGFEEAAAALDRNPLPWVALVTPQAKAQPKALAERLHAVSGVDMVQHDAAWRDRLDRMLALLRRIVQVLSLVLGLGAMLLIANAIRVDVMARREEISIVSLLGGSDAYVRRPFLYGGALYGLLGAAVAVAASWLVHLAISEPVAALAASYASGFRLSVPSPLASLIALIVGSALGWIGALVAATLQLLSDRAD